MNKIIISVSCLVLMACQSGSQIKVGHVQQPNIAERFVAAYNQHDIPEMMAWVHPEIKYMFVSGDQLFTETNGKTHLSKYLVPFFESQPTAQSRIIAVTSSGAFIQLVEEAVSTDASGNERSQCSLSVYELKDQLILNVWYYDAHACDI